MTNPYAFFSGTNLVRESREERKIMKKAIVLSMSLGLALAIAPAMHAAPVIFSYTASGSVSGVVGNSIVQTVSGETVTATAWAAAQTAGATFQAAALDDYAGAGFGLGVCTAAQLASTCNAPFHEVNDSAQYDFVLFTFSQAVNTVAITVNPVCNCFTDDSYFVGTGSPSGKTLAGLGTETTSDGNAQNVQRVITISGLNGATSLLFGTSTDESNNYFKIGGLSATVAAPEPASFGLAGLALIGLGVMRFKNRKFGKQ
jgi:hypothetical protein